MLIIAWYGVSTLVVAAAFIATYLIRMVKPHWVTSDIKPHVALFTVIPVAIVNGWWFQLSIGLNNELLVGIFISLIAIYCAVSMISGAVALTLLLIATYASTTSAIFNAEEVASRFNPEETTEAFFRNQKDTDMRIIPKSVAIDTGKKLLNIRMEDGTQLGAGYELDNSMATVQYVNEELTWVIPLTWKSPFKYFGNDTIPGYVKVSATDTEKQELVMELDGYPIAIKLAYSGFFSGHLNRHVQSDNVTSKLDGKSFFIDDEGQPYFASFKASPEVGFGNYIPDGVYVTNAQTGVTEYYKEGDEPEYIDYTYSEAIALDMVGDWGTYREGIYKAFFSSYKIKPTSYQGSEEMFFIDAQGMTNNTAFFTGLTNGSGNDALVGMLFMDARTGKAFIKYSDSGAPDESAVISSVVAALGNEIQWSPAQPIPYRIYDSLDIWLTPLISKNNKLVGYAATKVDQTALSVWDKTLEGTLSKIMSQGSTSGSVINEKLVEEVIGVLRSYRQISETKAMLTLNDVPILIECNTVKNDNCAAMVEGDIIRIEILKRSESRAMLTNYINSPVN